MKKQDIEALKTMDKVKLQSEGDKIRMEIAKMQMETSMNTNKDTNAVGKLKQRLAVVQTLLKEKQNQPISSEKPEK